MYGNNNGKSNKSDFFIVNHQNFHFLMLTYEILIFPNLQLKKINIGSKKKTAITLHLKCKVKRWNVCYALILIAHLSISLSLSLPSSSISPLNHFNIQSSHQSRVIHSPPVTGQEKQGEMRFIYLVWSWMEVKVTNKKKRIEELKETWRSKHCH